MNLPSPSHAAAPLTARHAVDPRHVHEQTDKPVPRPSHVLKGHSSLAQGSPRSGYPGDRSPPAPQPCRGWLPPATIRNHPVFRRSLTARPTQRLLNPDTPTPEAVPESADEQLRHCCERRARHPEGGRIRGPTRRHKTPSARCGPRLRTGTSHPSKESRPLCSLGRRRPTLVKLPTHAFTHPIRGAAHFRARRP